MKAIYNKPLGLLSALIAVIAVFICATLYESGFLTDELYLKLISAVNTEVSSSPLEVHFIDVGQAECILIKAPNKTVLIDAGNIDSGKKIENHLRSNGVYSLDLLIATHPHSDHIGAAEDILKKFPVGEVVIPQIPKEFLPTTSIFEDFIKTAARKNRSVSYAEGGKTYDLGSGAELSVFVPEYYGENLNNYSLILKLTFGETSFIFTGDAEEEIESYLLTSGFDLSATVYNAGHHGSTTSNSAEFLRAVGAKYAAISCGYNNDYGHPHQEIVSRFRDYNIKTYRTDFNGSIIFGSDGKTVTVKTEK